MIKPVVVGTVEVPQILIEAASKECALCIHDYTSSTGAVTDYVVRLVGSGHYPVVKKEDLDALTAPGAFARLTAGVDAAVADEAFHAILGSTKDFFERDKAKSDPSRSMSASKDSSWGIPVPGFEEKLAVAPAGGVYLTGVLVLDSKTKSAASKVVKSKPLTIAKNAISEKLPSHKFMTRMLIAPGKCSFLDIRK